MGPIILATVTVGPVDVAAAFGDLNLEATNNTGMGQWAFLFGKITGLNTGGASALSTRMRLLTSGTLQGLYSASAITATHTKEATSDSVELFLSSPFWFPSGDTVELRFDSGNASDTAASITMNVGLANTSCLHSGLLQSATGATATLATTASATADIFNGNVLVVVDGAGKGQTFIITDYTTGRVATLDHTPVTALDNTSLCAVLPGYIDASVARTTTADRKIDVSAGGEVGLDWANIGSPTTTVALTGTTVDLVADAVDASAFAANAGTEIAAAISASSTVPPTTIR